MCYYKNYQHRRRLHFLTDRLRAQCHFEDTLAYTPAERRQALLEGIDSHWGWHVTLVAGIGFFTDSYNIFASNMVIPMIGMVYFGGIMPSYYGIMMTAALLCGIALGSILFGIAADIYGRRAMYSLGLFVTIIGTLMVATATSGINESMSLLSWLIVPRFIQGIGIGGDYPLSAVITSQFNATHLQGRRLAFVFLCQALGQFAGPLFTLAVLGSTQMGKSLLDPLGRCVGDCREAVDFTWRLVVSFGAFPAILALFLRLWIPETPRYKLDVLDLAAQAELVYILAGRPKLTAGDLPRRHTADRRANRLTSFCGGMIKFFCGREYLRYLIGTSLSWFLMDFAFYGLGFNNLRVMSSTWPRNEDTSTSVHSAITRTASHYMLTGAMATAIGGVITLFNIERLGGRKVQMIGFFWLCVLFLVLGVVSLHLPSTHCSMLVIGLYILCQVFFNFGPNTTTFMIPAVIYPTRYRCTGHGISAAFGKIGSIIAQYLLNSYDNSNGPGHGSAEWFGYTLLMLSGLMLLGFVVTVYWIPETRTKDGKAMSLEEIAEKGSVRL